jgi:hypothetical protein
MFSHSRATDPRRRGCSCMPTRGGCEAFAGCEPSIVAEMPTVSTKKGDSLHDLQRALRQSADASVRHCGCGHFVLYSGALQRG